MDRSTPAVKFVLRIGRYGLMLVPFVFLLLFFAYPLASIFDLSFRPDGMLDLSAFARLFSSEIYFNTFSFTIWQAFLSTALTVGLALPASLVFARYSFPGQSLIMSVATLPFVLPTVVVAAAFLSLLGPRGVINVFLMDLFTLAEPPVQLERTLTLILIVHIFYNFAIALRIISAYWAHQDERITESARVLGASGWRLWLYVWLPVLRPAILAASVLVFIFTFTSFGIVLILGGIRFATLEVQIYYQALNLFNLPMASALSVFQIGTMFVMMLIYTRLQRRISGRFQSRQLVARRPKKIGERLFVYGTVIVVVMLLFAPLGALVLRAFTAGGTLSLEYFAQLGSNPRGSVLFVAPIVAVGNSLIFALITTLAALVLGLLTAQIVSGTGRSRFGRWLDPLFMLPLAASAVTLGFGYIIALDEPPLNLRSSWILVPIAHTLVAVPFVVRSVLPALRNIPLSIREAAATLGAAPFQVWTNIDLPLMSRGLVVGATFAFTVSMGEFGASLFVARPESTTVPLVIFRLLNQPGISNYGQAMAMSTVLMLICAMSFILIERLRTAGVGEF